MGSETTRRQQATRRRLLAEDVPLIPENAVDLFPKKLGPRILYLPSANAILKKGPTVRMAEAEALRFVRARTAGRVPLPEVYQAFVKDGIGYVLMERVRGEVLSRMWPGMDAQERARVVGQLRGFVDEWRSLRADWYGSLWKGPCEDLVFKHLCLAAPGEHATYGPFATRKEYNGGVVTALCNARPAEVPLSPTDKALIERLLEADCEDKVFTHGDLQPANILVDEVDGDWRVTGIIDWEAAGFSPPEREYCEARSRAGRDERWRWALDELFDKEVREGYALWKDIDWALVAHASCSKP